MYMFVLTSVYALLYDIVSVLTSEETVSLLILL